MSHRVTGSGNSVLVFERNLQDGTLTQTGSFETGGLGGLGGGELGFPGDFPTGVFGTPNDALASQASAKTNVACLQPIQVVTRLPRSGLYRMANVS